MINLLLCFLLFEEFCCLLLAGSHVWLAWRWMSDVPVETASFEVKETIIRHLKKGFLCLAGAAAFAVAYLVVINS